MSAKCHDISHPIVVANCANIPNMRLHIRAERMGSNTCTRWRVVQCVQLMMTRRSQGWINSDWEVMLLLPTLLCSIDCGKHSCDDKFVHGGDNVRCGGCRCRDASKVIFKSVLPVCECDVWGCKEEDVVPILLCLCFLVWGAPWVWEAKCALSDREPPLCVCALETWNLLFTPIPHPPPTSYQVCFILR